MPIAWDEIPLPWGKRTSPAPRVAKNAASFEQNENNVIVSSDRLTVTIDKKTGYLSSIKDKDVQWLQSPMTLNFWRPTTNNDEGAKLDHKLKVWQYAGQRAKAVNVTAAQEGSDVVVKAELSIPAANSKANITYRITGAAQLMIETSFMPDKGLPTIPRIGYQAMISNNAANLEWYGKGPQETYNDRQAGSWTTVHTGYIPNLFFRYADPQESGNHFGIRWATLSALDVGKILRIDATGDHLLELGAYPCKAADITLASHPSSIVMRDQYSMQIDHRHSGLGGTDSWGATALPQYQIPSNQNVQWSYMLTFNEVPIPPRRPMPNLPNLPPGLKLPDAPKAPTPPQK